MWPKPLPNHWLLGSTIGVSVDKQDHVWIIHRSSSTLNRERDGAGAEPADRRVLHRRAAGARVRSGGQPGASLGRPGPGLRVARQSNHGITVDDKGNVWIGGNGANDGQILKFTQDGKFIKQFGFG